MHSTLRSYQTILFRSLLIGLFLCATPASALTVSGTLYSDEGLTTIASGKTIKIAVGTSTPATVYTTTTDGSSNYSFTFSSLTATASLVVWVDATTSIRAATYTRASSTSNNITNLPLYQNRVVISHEGATTTTSVSNSDLAFYDATNDSDIQYDASSTLGTLLISTGSELHVMTGKVFFPQGMVTVAGNSSASSTDGSFHLPANAIYLQSATTTIAGSFSASSSALFYHNGGILEFNATTTGKTINATIPLGNIRFGGSGTYTFSSNATTTDLTIATTTTVVAPSTLTVTGNYSNSGTFTHNNGTVVFMNNGSVWNQIHSGTTTYFSSVVYSDGLFVAVAYGNQVMTSPDGVVWTPRSAATSSDWSSVTYGQGLFVAVASGYDMPSASGLVMTSPDGMNWTSRTAAGTSSWASVAYGNNIFVAVSGSGWDESAEEQVMTSPDGMNWTSRTAASASFWKSVTYANGLFVAVGSGNDHIMTSPDGITWTVRDSGAYENYSSVVYANGRFVAVGAGAKISQDGITWTARVFPVSSSMAAVTYGNGLFVAVPDSGGTRLVTSPDGITWTARETGRSGIFWLSDITYGNGTFVAVSNIYQNIDQRIMMVSMNDVLSIGDQDQYATGTMTGASAFHSLLVTGTSTHRVSLTTSASTTDFSLHTGLFSAPADFSISGAYTNSATLSSALKWTPQTAGSASYLFAVTYGNGTFVAIGYYDANHIETSPDGVTWTPHSAPSNSYWSSITYGNGLFVAVCSNNASYNACDKFITSPDGVTWTERTIPTPSHMYSVTYGNGLFVAVGSCSYDGDCVLTSPDGINWSAPSVPSKLDLRSVVYAKGLFVAVAIYSNGKFLTSTDGITWTLRSVSFVGTWRSVAYGNGLFVAVGSCSSSSEEPCVMYSSDGITWMSSPVLIEGYWNSVAYGNGLFVAVSELGSSRVMTSPDGITWTPQVVPLEVWKGVIFAQGKFIAVCTHGPRIMSAVFGTTTFNGASGQNISSTGSSFFGNTSFQNSGTKTLSGTTSAVNLTITSGTTVVAPAVLTLYGNYANSGTMTHTTSTTTLAGLETQTLSGNMTASNAFNNLRVTNTYAADTSAVIFAANASTTGTLSMEASTSAQFLASGKYTFQNISLNGMTKKPVTLRSSTPSTQFTFNVPGTQVKANYVDVKDSTACATTITVSNGVNSGNNNCWTFNVLPSISGKLFSDEGVSPLVNVKTIKIAIATTTNRFYTTTNMSDGTWEFLVATTDAYATSTRLFVWIDGDSTTHASLFTKASSTANIANLSLYQDRVVLSHETGTGASITNDDLSYYDADNDSDLRYTSNESGLSVFAGNELHVGAGKTFTPGGAVTIAGNAATAVVDGSFHMETGSTYTAGGDTMIAGSFTAASSTTFTAGNYTLLFNATTTGKLIDTRFLDTFGTSTFDGVGGGWTFTQPNATTSNLTITNGFVDLPATTLTITGNYIASGTVNHLGAKYWTMRSSPSVQDLYSVAYGDGTFVAIAFYGANKFITSSDGLTWATQTDPLPGYAWNDVAYGNGAFVVSCNETDTGDPCNTFLRSTDGINWTQQTVASTSRWSVKYVGSLFVAITGLAQDAIMTSPDGIIWDLRTLPPVDDFWNDVTYGNGVYVLLGQYTILTSPDGITWTSRATLDDTFYTITFGNGRFVATGATGLLLTSIDGSTWATSSIVYTFSDLLFANGLFVTSGSVVYGEYFIFTSRDGLAWTRYDVPSNSTSYWGSFAYGNNTFVAVGGYGNTMAASGMDTTTFSGASPQSITGTLSGNSSFGHLAFTGAGTKTFGSNASSTNFQIGSGATVVAPTALSIGGHYGNSGAFTANSGTVFLNGYATQTLSGTMTGSSAFANLTIMNTSGAGSSTQSINFTASASTTGTFTMLASTSARFLASATSTFQNIALQGTVSSPVYLRSSILGDHFGFVVLGAQTQVSNVHVRDAVSCPNTITVSSGVDEGNTLCWNFSAGSPLLVLSSYIWRMDDNAESPATLLGAENSTSTDQRWRGDRSRLRVVIGNTGTGAATNYQYRLQYASSSCAAWVDVPVATSSVSTEWRMDPSGWMLEGGATTDLSISTNPTGKSFVAGESRGVDNQTNPLTLMENNFTELEFSIASTLLSQPGETYCFRFSNQSDVSLFSFLVRPVMILTGRSRPVFGGAAIEDVGSGPIVTGGGASGGGASEGTGSGGAVGGGGAGGGGGLE